MKKVINSVEVVDVSELALYMLYTTLPFSTGKGSRPLSREQQGSKGEQKGSIEGASRDLWGGAGRAAGGSLDWLH